MPYVQVSVLLFLLVLVMSAMSAYPVNQETKKDGPATTSTTDATGDDNDAAAAASNQPRRSTRISRKQPRKED